MKFEIPPVEVSDLVPFSPPSSNCSASQNTFAGVSKNGLWMWLVCDTAINIYHTENSERLGGYSFGETLKNPSAKITAVTEFCSSHVSFSCLLIAVEHDHESLICMYDITTSKIFRAVLVPDIVLRLEVISGNGGACMDTVHLCTQLRYMFGIAAVGTSAGHVYFLDLCLDEDFSCNENLPNITLVLKKYELLPERREKAISKQQHVFILLNDQSVRNGSFEFESRSSSLGHFPYGKVHVTALKYIQSTVTLAVGFNFGGIQLWDLHDLCLLYTVANQQQEQPIITFAFQEPENDPRHFCYLWIIRGYSANKRPEDFSVATMYSLVYEKRTYVESFGYLYTELRNCIKRFEYRMTSDPFSAAQSSSSAGSCLLSCQTICQTDESHSLDVCSSNDSDTAAENMSLCFLSWTVWSHSEDTPTSYHLALFDLNQWYRAEMPSSNIRSDPSDLNPYFAHFSLEEVAQIFDLEPLLGLYAVPHSIKKFKYISPSEEFFFPSALDFQTTIFSTNGICKTTFMGLQKRLLYEIADMGPNVLVNPKDVYSNLIRCGLVSDPHSTSDRVPLIAQRETLMQLALEYHMPFFFMKCLKEWRYADSIQEGCTSRALLNWAWKKVIQIKSSVDKLTIPFFNCSGSDIDKAPLKCLYGYRRQLDLIDTIFMGYQKFAAPRTEQGIQELKCRKDVVHAINMYLQVMLWLRSVHVLPEVCEGEETEKNMLYPVNALLNLYLKRRSHLQKIHGSIGPTDIFLIDGLMKEAFSENTWQEKGGNGNYPPPSIYAALSCYLLDDVPLELKHSLMYYLLLDICDASHNAKSPLASEVRKFPSVFGMSQSVAKLVRAFWYLDQFNFEVAIKKLLHPSVKATDVLPWQHQRVIKSFLYQREARKALKYINRMEPPENSIEDMKLHLSVLLARGAIIQAFDYQRSKQSIGCGTELLNHLFLGCQELHKLKDLMYMPLNTFESSTLIKFLSENEDPRAQEALVMYYLLRCNYFEAAKVNEKLSTNSVGRSVSSRERMAGRDALVEGLLASVPNTEKNLVAEINRFSSIPIKKAETLKPLSLSIKSVPMKQITYSDILNSLISEASSAMCAPYLDPQTPLRSVNRSCYENLPFLRPPLTPEPIRITENIHSTPVTKRTLTSASSEFSSPSKKSRLLDNAPFRSPLSKKKIPKHLAGDVASLLQSPPIHRRSSKHIKDMPLNDPSASAPQGILKKKAKSANSAASDIYTRKTPSLISDAGEDSDSEDENEMIVEDAPDDIPGRQIRFSVPSKEELNTSVASCISAESPVSGISYDRSSFLQKLEKLKGLPFTEEPDARELISVTRRNALLSLTREPLKSHAKLSPDKTVPLSENKFPCEKSSVEQTDSPAPSTTSSVHSQYTVQQATGEPSVFSIDASDSDSCSAQDARPKEVDYKITLAQSSSHVSSSSVLSNIKSSELDVPPLLNFSGSETPLNKSGSSSGNSSYSSASERSFIITPRKPLRDNSRNTSFSSTSMVSAPEAEKDQTLLGDEMVIDDSNDNDDNYNDNTGHSGGDQDICIIDEVSAPSIEKMETNKTPAEEECILLDVPDSESSTHVTVQNTCGQHLNIVFETDRSNLSNNAFLADEASLDIEQIYDSRDQNSSSGQVSENVNNVSIPEAENVHNVILEIAQGIPENINVPLEEDQLVESTSNQCAVEVVIVNPSLEVNDQLGVDCTSNAFAGEDISVKPLLEVTLDQVGIISTDRQVTEGDINVKTLLEVTEDQPDTVIISNQSVECTESHISEYVKVSQNEGEVDQPEVVADGTFIQPTESQVSKSSADCALEMPDFAKEASVPTLPVYVPIKERISRSQQNVSEISKFDEGDDTEGYPSLLLQEQLKDYDEVFKNQILDGSADVSTVPSFVKPVEKLESIAESSQNMETDVQETENLADSKSMSPPTLASNKDLSQKLTERFEFLSKNSDFYENNKLYKETMNLLKTDIPQNFEFDTKKKSARKTRTYVFKVEKKTGLDTAGSDNLASKFSEEAGASKKFLESWHSETYEQFSSSIHKGRSDDGQTETLKSSPNTGLEKSSISLFEATNKKELSMSASKGERNKESKSISMDKKQRSKIKKAKDKTTKKMEFSFAEPHSPAGPEILEALTTPSQYPVGSFMFSPPLTRGRLRQKRMDDSLSSSFASVTSEASFIKSSKPAVDPILEEIIAEKAPESQNLIASTFRSKTKSSAKKKTMSKRTPKIDVPRFEISDTSINVSSLVDTESPDLSTSKVLSSTKYATKHKMVLRQAKTKSRTEQLF